MFTTVVRAARVRDLRHKLALTVSLLLVYRVGALIPGPGISYRNVHECVGGTDNDGVLAMINLFSGGSLLKLAIFSLGVMPYITASIILQLLTSVIPKLSELKKDGGAGAAKITQYTRYTTVALGAIQAGGLVYAVSGTPSRLFPNCGLPVVTHPGWFTDVTLFTALVGGTVLVMWIGERITDKGIGNGMSLLMMTSIAALLPAQFAALVVAGNWAILGGVSVGLLALICAVVFMEQAQRRVKVTYAQKVSGSRTVGGGATYLPLKVNQAGVVPVIFASSLLYMPAIIARFLGPTHPFALFVDRYFASGAHPVYVTAYVVLIAFFAFFYVAMTYNPVELSDNIRNAGGFIPGVSPGEPTADHLDFILTRLTVVGAAYLSLVAVLPLVLLAFTGGVNQLPLGGTSLLILVGVGLETVKQLDSQLQQRSYPGLLSR